MITGSPVNDDAVGPKVAVEVIDGVHVVTLDDHARRNALDVSGAAVFAELIRSLADTADAVIVTGRGSAFCAGADLADLFGDGTRPVPEAEARLRSYYRSFLEVGALRCPTIAAVNGPAVGAGLNLALSCDLRLAAPTARFGATFSRIGVHPGGGCSYLLAEAIGRQRALRILLEGRTLDADEALAAGLVAEVVEDPVAEAIVLAKRLAGRQPWLAASIKRSMQIAAADGFDAALSYETWAQAASAHGQSFS